MLLRNDYPPVTRGKLVVWGYLASYPFGGMTWQVLHHLWGLRQLGFDVWYVEDLNTPVLDPTSLGYTDNYAPNLDFMGRYMEAIGLKDRWVYRPHGPGGACLGALDSTGLSDLYRSADAVLNVCGAQHLHAEHDAIDCLIYLETDPVSVQVAVAKGDDNWIRELDRYHWLFTYGANLGASDCPVPVARYTWHPTQPPVCIDWWRNSTVPPPGAALTTIANWRHSHAHKDVVWQGQRWRWSKHLEFERFIGVASRSPVPLEIAIGAASEEDRNRLSAAGWRLRSPRDLNDPMAYRDYVCNSLGEFTATKEQYVAPHTGWFSDRSVCYLAASRPVVTQETGFSKHIRTGEGLLGFANEEQAVAALCALAADYPRHAQAALSIAQEYFAAERVLGNIMRRVGLM